MTTIVDRLLTPAPNGAKKPPPPPPGAPVPENDVTDWPEPEDLALFDAPELPADLLPPFLELLTTSIADAYEVPPELVINSIVGAVSTAVSGRLDVRCSPTWTEPVCLYLATVLPPGERKSAITKCLSFSLTEAEKGLVDGQRVNVERDRARRVIRETRASRLEKTAADAKDDAASREAEDAAIKLRVELAETPPLRLPRVLVQDVTAETLMTIIFEQSGRAAVFSAEASILDSIGRYASKGTVAALDVLLSAHAGDAIRIDRRGRAEFVERPCLTLVVALQPHHLERWGKDGEVAGRGLLDRFAIFLPRPRVGFRGLVDGDIDRQAFGQFHVVIQRLVSAFHPLTTPHVISFSPDAAEAFLAWRRVQEPRRRPANDLGHIASFSSKSEGLVARLAALFAAAEAAYNSEGVLGALGAVSLDQIQRAIRLTEVYLEHATGVRHLIKIGDEGSDVRALSAWVMDRPQGFTTRDVQQALKRRFGTVDALREALATLQTRHWIRRARGDGQAGKGRPRERWEVNSQLKGSAPIAPKTPLAGAA